MRWTRRWNAWPALRVAVEAGTDILLSPGFRRTLRALVDLYPGHDSPHVLLDLLDRVDEVGLDPTLRQRQEAHDRQVLVWTWIDTPTWAESMAYHREHQAELSSDEIRELLATIDHDAARQHAAILDLADRVPLETVYAIVTDAGTAEHAALTAVEDGDLDVLAILATASPALHSREEAMDLLAAVLLLADGQVDQALELADQIAEQAEATARRAFAVHLRGLHRRRPELTDLDRVIDAITGSDR